MASKKKQIEFYVHGKRQLFTPKDHPHETSLCDYLRDVLHLTGTKIMCREGGCGACVVAVTFEHPVTKEETTVSVNSCLVSIFSCSKWKISTIEGLGGSSYNDIQETIVENNATQCGYCTSGMIMNMYALQKKLGNKLSKKDIENAFGGNMCRCTGYRAIISAFRKLAKADDDYEMVDIEDLERCSSKCKKDADLAEGSLKCLKGCFNDKPPTEPLDYPHVYDTDSDVKWYRVSDLNELKEIYKTYPLKQIRLVAGNTAQGVYKDMAVADVCVDINSVAELKTHQLNTNELELGGNVTLTEAIEIFKSTAEADGYFKYLEKFAEHLDLVAHVPVRNVNLRRSFR